MELVLKPGVDVLTRSRQRYGMLLLALAALFVFGGITKPGDLQRVIGTLLTGATLTLALYAAEIRARRMVLATAVIAAVVAGVVIESAFSFVTLTTVGYGDYTARTSLGHTLSVSEALLGRPQNGTQTVHAGNGPNLRRR